MLAASSRAIAGAGRAATPIVLISPSPGTTCSRSTSRKRSRASAPGSALHDDEVQQRHLLAVPRLRRGGALVPSRPDAEVVAPRRELGLLRIVALAVPRTADRC